MTKKRGGSPAYRSVMKKVTHGKENKVKSFPVRSNNVPQSVKPNLSGGKRKRRTRRRRRTKGGSPLSDIVQRLYTLKALTAKRCPSVRFPRPWSSREACGNLEFKS